MKEQALLLGLTNLDYVALIGGVHSLGSLDANPTLGFVGERSATPLVLSNGYFVSLLNETCARRPLTVSSPRAYL